VIEFLGEEDKSLIDFIIQKITTHTEPKIILEKISYVFDKEAESFVHKIWW
jgi:hypothetical protein